MVVHGLCMEGGIICWIWWCRSCILCACSLLAVCTVDFIFKMVAH